MPRRGHGPSKATRRLIATLDITCERLSYMPECPPRDYIFVPKGNVYMTRHCQDLTKQAGETLYVVFRDSTHERLGLHCPKQIYEAVEEDAAASAEKRQRAVETKDHRDLALDRHLLSRHFPRIPKDSAEEILEHGFPKSSGRLRKSMILDEEIKIELAVNAYIRHRFTNYDSLYAQMKAENVTGDLKRTARTSVYDQVRKIAQSWRGLGLAGNKTGDDAPDKQSDNHDQNLNSNLWPKCELPPQRQAAMIAKLVSFANHKHQNVIEYPGHPTTSDNDPMEPHREYGHVSLTHTLERALDHMNLDDETFGSKNRADLKETPVEPMIAASDTSLRHTYQHHLQDVSSDIPKGEGRARPVIAEVYEEQAKEDLEILKNDFSYKEHMTQRQIQEVVKLHQKLLQEDPQYAFIVEPTGPEDEMRRAARLAARRIDPRRSAKIMLRKENRRKDTMEDLRRYKLGEEVDLPRKRSNRLRRLLKKERAEEYASLRYRDTPEKRLRNFNAVGGFATVSITNSREETIMPPAQHGSVTSSMRVMTSSGKPNEKFADESDGSNNELEWIDIS